jgi:hypothetical protein
MNLLSVFEIFDDEDPAMKSFEFKKVTEPSPKKKKSTKAVKEVD